jgi:hypothetical protein
MARYIYNVLEIKLSYERLIAEQIVGFVPGDNMSGLEQGRRERRRRLLY